MSTPRIDEQITIVLTESGEAMTLTEIHRARAERWNLGITHGLGATGASLERLRTQGKVTRSHNGSGASTWRWIA